MSNPAKLFNKNNLLPGKIADEFLVFQENKTFGTNRTMAVEVTLPVIDTGYSQEEEESGEERIYPEKIGKESLIPTQDFMVEAKPLIKDLTLYSDKENPWTNKTFVITKFERIIPKEVQLDIEGKEPINHLLAFTSTDGNTLNIKEMTSQEVNEMWVKNDNLFDVGESKLNLTLYPDDIKALLDVFAEFLKDAPASNNKIEMAVSQDNRIYLSATNDDTQQTIRGVCGTIPESK